MSDYHIYQDYSGTLKTNIFYQLAVSMDEDLVEFEYAESAGWIITQKRSPTKSELLLKGSPQSWLDASIIESKKTKKHRCSADNLHVTEEYFTDLKIEIHNAIEAEIILSDFNFSMDEEDQAFLVTDKFADRITKSGLKGAGFVPVTINYSDAENEKAIPTLFALQFMGQNCLRPTSIQGAKNACPFCGHEPLICQECGFDNYICPTCQKPAWTTQKNHKGSNDKHLIVSPLKQRETLVMEGSKWDGSDFVYAGGNSLVYNNLISQRALDWLLSIHAVHFCARPIQVCIDGMTDQQLEMLATVQKPIVS